MSSRHSLPSDIHLLDAVSSLHPNQRSIQTTTSSEQGEPASAFRLEEAFDAFFEAFELEPEPLCQDNHQDQIELFLPDPNHRIPDEQQIELGGMSRPVFNILVDGSDQLVEFYNAGSLLESMEQQGVQMPYQCREGYCGACRTQLVKGTVTYLQEPMAWLNEGEMLPCCCIPLSDIQIKMKG
jgi:ferredoxin